MMTIYEKKGYVDRDNYLQSLADDYGVDEEAVFGLAEILGPNEDFDALVSNLEDIMYGGFEI